MHLNCQSPQIEAELTDRTLPVQLEQTRPLCVCVCMYVCMHACMYWSKSSNWSRTDRPYSACAAWTNSSTVCMYVFMYVCVYVHTCICTHILILCVYAYVLAFMRTYMWCECTYMHTYIHTKWHAGPRSRCLRRPICAMAHAHIHTLTPRRTPFTLPALWIHANMHTYIDSHKASYAGPRSRCLRGHMYAMTYAHIHTRTSIIYRAHFMHAYIHGLTQSVICRASFTLLAKAHVCWIL
jgi:hypothetical protein